MTELFLTTDTPAEDRYALTSTPWTQSFLKDGDQWVSETAFGDLKETFKFKLGQEVTYKTLSGETVVATFNIKDNKVVGSGTEGGKPVSSCDSIVDGKLQITIMEKLIGKWEVIREASEGEEVYLDKNEVPQEDRQVMQTIVWTQTFSQDGDEWVSETEAGDVKDRFKFTLGTEITHTTNTGKTIVVSACVLVCACRRNKIKEKEAEKDDGLESLQ
ncbi:hypothetical protein C0Q70_18315 [Pomacea canaliculata]|uniref:Lipocalin/cytosolic fatty-acid binding domain-containing protein n=1 Tax=Pomacea canaliculata TaxID=400727 RepID=A0A2T7NMV4_POMCA|nr:hypothetical protein C0Q70_18315 [Pomacea canaliculata]